jgi:hypothetical protein
MAQDPVLPTNTRQQLPKATIAVSPRTPLALTPANHILFSQRLALLIKRLRAATKEGTAHEQ